MAPTTPATHDSALAQPASNAAPQATSPLPTGIAGEISATDLAAIQNLALDQNQIMHLLRSLPGVFNKVRIYFPSFSFLLSRSRCVSPPLKRRERRRINWSTRDSILSRRRARARLTLVTRRATNPTSTCVSRLPHAVTKRDLT